MATSRLKRLMRSRRGIAYVWVAGLAAVFLVAPLLWYVLNQAAEAVIEAGTGLFPDSFATSGRAGADGFIRSAWRYAPLLVLVAVLLWSITRSLAEKKAERWYG